LLLWGLMCVLRFGLSCVGAGSGRVGADCVSGIFVCCFGAGFVSCDLDFLDLALDPDV